LTENETTTIIKTPFLEFLNKINEEEKQNNIENNINKPSKLNRLK